MAKTKHLETKFSIARYALIKLCEGDELRFYQYVKLYAINKNSAFPSFKAFKKDLGWSRYTTNRIAKMMEKKKRLKVERRKGKNNIYNITWYDSVNIKGIKGEEFSESRRETLPTSRRETLPQTNRKKTNNSVIIKNFGNGERRVIPVGEPPPGTGEKPNPKGLKRLAEIKKPFLEKSAMVSDKERAEIQEEVAIQIRPSGIKQ